MWAKIGDPFWKLFRVQEKTELYPCCIEPWYSREQCICLYMQLRIFMTCQNKPSHCLLVIITQGDYICSIFACVVLSNCCLKQGNVFMFVEKVTCWSHGSVRFFLSLHFLGVITSSIGWFNKIINYESKTSSQCFEQVVTILQIDILGHTYTCITICLVGLVDIKRIPYWYTCSCMHQG